jgi:pyridoxal phosphate enzyme (YggS family)
MTSVDSSSSQKLSLDEIRRRISAAVATHELPQLIAVSKKQSADAIRRLAALGQRAFGENYVQEALTKQNELRDLNLEWHCIGPLQSNKCREVAENFAWLQSLDRTKLIAPLQLHRPQDLPALNVLIQVNIDDETSKSGCAPELIETLAAAIGESSRLRLHGLMAIPAPHADVELRRAAFIRMRELFLALQKNHVGIDTLSMGMSEDFELAIAHGATMVRIGSALFGTRAVGPM